MQNNLFGEPDEKTFREQARAKVIDMYAALLLQEKPVRSVNADEVGEANAARSARQLAQKDYTRFAAVLAKCGYKLTEGNQ